MIPARWKPTPSPETVCTFQAPCPCCGEVVWWRSRIDGTATRVEVTEVCQQIRRRAAA